MIKIKMAPVQTDKKAPINGLLLECRDLAPPCHGVMCKSPPSPEIKESVEIILTGKTRKRLNYLLSLDFQHKPQYCIKFLRKGKGDCGRASHMWRSFPWCSTHQRPEDIDCKKCYGQRNQANGFQAAVELQVVLGSAEAQPAGDGSQWGDEEETHHVTEEGPFLIAWPGVL